MVTTRPPKTIVEPTALGTVANTNTKLLIYRLFQEGRVLAQDGLLRDDGMPMAFCKDAGCNLSTGVTIDAGIIDEPRPGGVRFESPVGIGHDIHCSHDPASRPVPKLDPCAPQKVYPALIARFRPAMVGCFLSIFFFADHSQ